MVMRLFYVLLYFLRMHRRPFQKMETVMMQ